MSPCEPFNMANIIITPDWTSKDLEICAKSDELVKQGKMTYRHIR